MSHEVKYIGMDVHKEAIVIAVLNGSGKQIMETIVETKASSILEFLHGLRGELHVTWEEGTWAAWLYDLLQPQVQEVVVCNPAPPGPQVVCLHRMGPFYSEARICLKVLRRGTDNADKRECGRPPEQGGSMTVGSISAAGLSEGVLSSSNSNQLKQILDTLQNSLTSGDLNGAQSAFQSLQTLSQNQATASGSSLSSSQLSTDLTTLDSALSSGDLTSAQSAFTTIQSDLKNAASPSLTLETNVASQSQQLVQELLSSLSSSSSSSSTSDNTTSVLETVYGNRRLNVQA